MKKIINGRRYDTETAPCVGTWENACPRKDPLFCAETLHRKRNGEFFIHGEGGARSKYAVRSGGDGWTSGEDLIPLPYDAAREWAESHLSAGGYEKLFGTVPKDGKKQAVNLYVSAAAAVKIEQEAAKEGITKSAYMERLIMGKED